MASGPSRERSTLTLEELDRLAEAVPGEYRALMLMAGVLGLRWSECAGLRVEDVDFLRRTLRVRQTIAEVEGRLIVADTKSRSSSRTLSVPAFLVEEVAEHLASHRAGAGPDDLVFTSPEGGPLRRYFAERVFIPAVKLAGIDQALGGAPVMSYVVSAAVAPPGEIDDTGRAPQGGHHELFERPARARPAPATPAPATPAPATPTRAAGVAWARPHRPPRCHLEGARPDEAGAGRGVVLQPSHSVPLSPAGRPSWPPKCRP
ncbi:MAG: tyrosine-type recombinase/integrase, partial [Acidimicrobiales bacterium]